MVLMLLYVLARLFLGLCIHTSHVPSNYVTHTSLPCNITLVDMMAALSTSVATMGSYEFDMPRLRS